LAVDDQVDIKRRREAREAVAKVREALAKMNGKEKSV
jgi:hypothetical protein